MIFCMGHLLYNNMIHRWYHWGEHALNVNGPLMILTQKMTQLAFAVHDGRQKNLDHMSAAFRRDYAGLKCSTTPTLLEVFGHTFFFCNVLAGPNHQFGLYKDFIEGNGRQAKYVAPAGKALTLAATARKLGCSVADLQTWNKGSVDGIEKLAPSDTIESGTTITYTATARGGLVHGLQCMAVAFAWMGWNMIGGVGYFTGKKLDPKLIPEQPIYDVNSFIEALFYMWASMQVYRCTFYFAWLVSEGANNVAGLGYAGDAEDGTPKWDALTNVRVLRVEVADNLKMVLDNWNMQTQNWLRYVCYERLGVSSPLPTMLLSALWHGPYLGYYMTFATAAFMVEANRKVRYNIRPYFVPEGATKSNSLYYFLGWLTTCVLLNYLVGPFVMLTVDGSLKYWNNQYWFMHILVLLTLVVLPGKKKAKKDADLKKQ